MSILKAYRADFATRDADDILTSFQNTLEKALDRGDLGRDEVVTLVAFYAEFGVAYLRQVAYTFRDPEGSQQSMKFMNSVIAEAVHEAGLHYYNKEHGYSLIDKAVQEALDNNGSVSVDVINHIIDDIEITYIEEEETEVEH
jgi:hypothetical protein